MEDEDDVEGAELVAGDAQVEADDDGVEDDAEFEDEKGGDLLPEGQASGFRGAVLELGVEVESVVGDAGLGCGAWGIDFFAASAIGDGALDVLVRAEAVFGLDVALCSKVEEEDEHDGCEYDGGGPGIQRPISRHAHAGVGSNLAVCGVQEVDEGGGDDDAGAEVAGEEVDVDGDAETWDSFSHDGEKGCAGGYDHDDEEGGYAGAELTVVFIAGGFDEADDIAWVGGCEVDVGGVEIIGTEVGGRHDY